MMTHVEYSVVIPVFNGAETIEQLSLELAQVMNRTGKSFEIILVDDGSPDDSWPRIKALAEEDPRIRGIQLMRNFGQPAATMAGLRGAKGRILITMDDDFQNPPEEVPRLIRKLETDRSLDVVFGVPAEKKHALWRRCSSAVINLMTSRVFIKESGLKLTSFRAMRREVVEPLFRLNVPSPAAGALVATVTNRIGNIEVRHTPRLTGRSGYTMTKLLNLTIGRFLSFSTFPLRFLALMGVAGVALSMIIGSVLLFKYMFGRIGVPGWTTIVLLLVAMSGFSFLAFGIVGEYLQQILLSVRGTPQFIVRSKAVSATAEHPSCEDS